jgi:hypothetical protein
LMAKSWYSLLCPDFGNGYFSFIVVVVSSPFFPSENPSLPVNSGIFYTFFSLIHIYISIMDKNIYKFIRKFMNTNGRWWFRATITIWIFLVHFYCPPNIFKYIY